MKVWLSVVVALGLLLSACAASQTLPETPKSPVVQEPPWTQQPPEAQEPIPDLPLQPSTEFVVRQAFQPGEELRGNGLYFTETTTGRVEGWATAHTEGAAIFPVAGDSRWLVALTPPQGYLVDRQSQKVWQWPRQDLTVVAASGGLVLFELHGADPETRFVVVNADLQAISVFKGRSGPEHSRAHALFAPDGQRLALLGHDQRPYLVDVPTGRTAPLGTGLPQREGFNAVPSLRLSRDGAQIQVLTGHYPGREWKPEFYTDIQRFGWDGREAAPILTVPGTTPFLSPDGRLVAYETPFQGKVSTVVIADAATGEPGVWTRSAALCYQDDGTIGGRWLADGSGVLMRTWGDQFRIMTVEGTLQSNAVWGARGAEPMPAPDSPRLLALSNKALVDLSGRILQPAPKTSQGVGDTDPWGVSSQELLITLPHYGHGPRCGFIIGLPPKVETARIQKYEAPLQLRVNTPGDCLNLRAEAGGRVVKCLPDGTGLTVTPDKQTVPLLMVEQPLVGDHYWVHVRADPGDEGWVAVNAEFLAWAP